MGSHVQPVFKYSVCEHWSTFNGHSCGHSASYSTWMHKYSLVNQPYFSGLHMHARKGGGERKGKNTSGKTCQVLRALAEIFQSQSDCSKRDIEFLSGNKSDSCGGYRGRYLVATCKVCLVILWGRRRGSKRALLTQLYAERQKSSGIFSCALSRREPYRSLWKGKTCSWVYRPAAENLSAIVFFLLCLITCRGVTVGLSWWL